MLTRNDTNFSWKNVDRIFKHARAIPWEADASTWRMTHVGEQAEAILGYPVDEWYHDSFWVDHIHPEDRNWVVAFCEARSKTETEYEFEYRMVRRDGSIVWLQDLVNVEVRNGSPKTIRGFMIDISQQKRLIQRAAQSEEQLKTMLELAPDAIGVVREDGMIIYVNKKFRSVFGYTSSELLGQKIELLIPTDFRGGHEELRKSYLENPVPRAMSALSGVFARRKNGDSFPAEISLSPLPSATGVLVCCSIRDITERISTEKIARKNEDRFRMIYENAPVMIDAFNDEGRCVMWNSQCEKVFGWTAEEIYAHKNPIELFYPDPKIREDVVDTVTSTPDGVFREWKPRRKNGSETTCLWANFKLPDGLVINLGYDITKQKRVEDALRESEATLQLLLSSTAEAIYGLDQSGLCTFANVACLDLLGYSRVEELLGRNMHSLIHHTRADGRPYPEGESLIYKAFKREQGTHVDGEVLWRKDGTSFQAEYRSYPIRNGATVEGSVVTFLDITDRRRAEAEARNLRDQIAHVSRVSSLGELSTSLAHELNQPLAAIMSNAQAAIRLLDRPDKDIGDAMDALNDIVADTMRAGKTIESLRKFIRSNESETRPTSINELTREVFDLIHSESIIEHIAVTLDLQPGLPPVRGDRTQLQQVLLNLILNAKDAVKKKQPSDRKIKITTKRSDSGEVHVGVTDSGPGISAENLDKIFEPFYSTKDEGLGIGLSISRSIVEAQDGRIWAVTPANGGTTIAFALPACEMEET